MSAILHAGPWALRNLEELLGLGAADGAVGVGRLLAAQGLPGTRLELVLTADGVAGAATVHLWAKGTGAPPFLESEHLAFGYVGDRCDATLARLLRGAAARLRGARLEELLALLALDVQIAQSLHLARGGPAQAGTHDELGGSGAGAASPPKSPPVAPGAAEPAHLQAPAGAGAVLSLEEIRARVDSVPWFQAFELVPGVVTPGRRPLRPGPHLDGLGVPGSLAGLTALDVGAWDGALSFALAARGARTTAIDVQDPRRTGFSVAQEILGVEVEYLHLDEGVYALPEALGGRTFDVVLFAGVYYHLKNPIGAFEALARVMGPRSLLYFEGNCLHSHGEALDGRLVSPAAVEAVSRSELPLAACYPGRYQGGSNWFVPNVAGLRSWLLAAGFEVLSLRTEALSDAVPASHRALGVARRSGRGPMEEHPLVR